MEYSKMSIGPHEFGTSYKSKIDLTDKYGVITNFQFYDPSFDEQIKDKNHPNYKNIQLYLMCLSICHTVIVQNKDTTNLEKITYQSSSPDELALVNAARYFKFVFIKRDIHNNIFINQYGQDIRYEILHIIEYTSDR